MRARISRRGIRRSPTTRPARAFRTAAAYLSMALLAATTLTSLAACSPQSETRGRVAKADSLAQAPAYESWDVTLSRSRDGRPRLRLRAPYLARYERGDTAYVDLGAAEAEPYTGAAADSLRAADARVHVDVFDENGRPSATIAADRVRHLEDAARYVARGGVVVETTGGKRLEGEHLVWHERDARISTPGFVRITTPTERIQGYALEADEHLDTYSIARVTGQVLVEDDPVAEAPGAETPDAETPEGP